MANKAKGSAVSFEWVAAPEDLAAYLNSLYILRAGDADIEEMMPAYSGQVCVPLRGSGTMEFHDGTTARTSPCYFLGPLTQAQRFTVKAGSVTLGASLNVRGWTAFSGIPADEAKNTAFPAEKVLEEEAAQRLLALNGQVAEGHLTEREALDVLADVIRQGVKPLPVRHEQVIAETTAWLSSSFKPEIADLMEALPYSERQVQRLVTRFFGQPPVRLIRRFRAVRAATLLTMEKLDPALEAEVRASFYDQAHMIKEIRHFVGKTPRRLQPSQDTMVRETLGEPGYGTVDLFGGNQDEALGRAPR